MLKFLSRHSLYIVLFLTSNSGYLSAQRLPNIQKDAVWLPRLAKVDGKLTEWKDSLSAFQRNNQLQYTIAHDSTRLYLAFRTSDNAIKAKIMAGGLSLMFNASGNKRERGPEITFPVPNSGYSSSSQNSNTMRYNFKILTDSVGIHEAILKLKEIRVARIKGVSDNLLSIYNEYNIQTKLKYANNALVGELMIPMELLGLSFLSSFSYNIKLNGVPYPAASVSSVPPPPAFPPSGRRPSIADEIRNPTDFWGMYTLKSK